MWRLHFIQDPLSHDLSGSKSNRSVSPNAHGNGFSLHDEG